VQVWNFVRLHDLVYKEGAYPPTEGLFTTFIKASHGNEMKNKAILHAILQRDKRRAETHANPSWWTLKRWSEFMWFTQIVAKGKRAALRLISSGFPPIERT
jgi:hypothetical protein